MANSEYYIQDNSDIENKKLEAAKGLYQSGNYSSALKLYLDMVNMSYSHKLNYEIGRCYYKLNDLANALKFFQNSINIEKIKNPSYPFIGNIYFKQQEIKKAIEAWSTAFSYRPDDESVCLNLATSYFSQNMKYYSVFYYEKYLKYAKNKTSNYYVDVQKSMQEFEKMGNEFYQKGQRAVSMNDNETAIQALEYAVNYIPTNFDVNYLLGKLYFEEKQYMKALLYLKQAYCLDKKSLDTLQKLSSTMIHLGDFTGAYCCFKRILPLVIHNQKEYLEVIKTIRKLEESFDQLSYSGHMEWADNYYNDNNYILALFEYENCLLIDPNLSNSLDNKVVNLRRMLNPEEKIIRTCLEKGGTFYSTGDFRQANKYFSKVISLAKEDSSEYKIAKSRIVNV